MHGQVRAAEKILIDTSADASEARARYLEILDAAGLKEDVMKGVRSGEWRVGGVVTRKNSDVPVGAGEVPGGVVVPPGSVIGDGVGEVHVVRPMEGAGGHGVWKEILWPTAAVRRMLVVLVGTNFFQQVKAVIPWHVVWITNGFRGAFMPLQQSGACWWSRLGPTFSSR